MDDWYIQVLPGSQTSGYSTGVLWTNKTIKSKRYHEAGTENMHREYLSTYEIVLPIVL